jgi:hypothetical protein
MHWRPEKAGEQLVGWGQCRRMPPAMPPIQDDKLVHVGLWPHTQESDWCGEWHQQIFRLNRRPPGPDGGSREAIPQSPA